MKKVLIIGGTSGIAQAIAAQLAREGAALFLLGRSAARLELVAANLQSRFAANVTVGAVNFDEFAVHAPAIEQAATHLGGLDLAIICYGSLGDQKACEQDFRLTEAEFRTNCLGAMSFLSHLANRFEARRAGQIIAISSVAGDRGRQSNYIYGAAKAGLTAYLQGLRNRLHPAGVHVLTVKPGFVDTPMASHIKKGPLMASPETVARDILRASEAGRCVLYTPWFWRWIMLVIKLIPESIFRRLKL
ncbi:MAG: SDR family oxidoreductase [Verrucomicrobiota bacterium]|jgi:short-subunit dehydrogenase